MKPCYHSIILLHFPLPTRHLYFCNIIPQVCLWPFCNGLMTSEQKSFQYPWMMCQMSGRSQNGLTWDRKPLMLKGIVMSPHHPRTFLDKAISQSISSCLCLKCCHLYSVCACEVFSSNSFAYFHIHVPGFFFFLFPTVKKSKTCQWNFLTEHFRARGSWGKIDLELITKIWRASGCN